MKQTNILKALAIGAVVFLHYNAFRFSKLTFFSDDWQITLFFDQLVRFCVPLFVALSGYALTKKYLETPFSLKDFVIRRLSKLLPLYILWSFIIFCALRSAIVIPSWQVFVYGLADYHLYFVPMIFQLYLLFPVIFFLSKKYSLIVLILSFILQVITLNYWSNHLNISDQEQYRHILTWIFYFVLGVFLAFHQEKLQKIPRLSLLILPMIIIGFIWCYADALKTAQSFDLIIATKSSRFPVMLYGGGMIAAGILYGHKLAFLPLATIGAYSYLIYLSHTLFLRLLNPGDTKVILVAGMIGLTLSISPLFLPLLSQKFTKDKIGGN